MPRTSATGTARGTPQTHQRKRTARPFSRAVRLLASPPAVRRRGAAHDYLENDLDVVLLPVVH